MLQTIKKINRKRIYLTHKLKNIFLRLSYGSKFEYNEKIFSQSIINELSLLFDKFGSDKGYIDFNKNNPFRWKAHTYSNVYDTLFGHCKDHINLIFECGIGTNNPNFTSNMTINGKPGASLKAWSEYFKNAEIYGADIDKEILFQEKKIKTFYVDQLNEKSILDMWNKINKKNFDLIIDDGLHSYDSNVCFFYNSFDYLKKNGLYIIEDIHQNYLYKLYKTLKKFNPKVIILNDKKHFNPANNMMIIKKS